MKCNACTSDAIIVYRIAPHTATKTLFDTTPRNVAACKGHLEAAQKIGKVLSATPLGDGVVTRTVT